MIHSWFQGRALAIIGIVNMTQSAFIDNLSVFTLFALLGCALFPVASNTGLALSLTRPDLFFKTAPSLVAEPKPDCTPDKKQYDDYHSSDDATVTVRIVFK